MAFYSMPKDDFLAIVVPILVYWAYSGVYLMLGSLDNYRLHSRTDEDALNLVTKRKVAFAVFCQQLMQAASAIILFKFTSRAHVVNSNPSFMLLCYQFLIGMLVVDTWQYFVHRYMHMNKFLYKHVHSLHHRLVVPYSFGAQYNHPIEGFILDTMGGALGFLLSGMSPRTSIYFFSFFAMKSIDDHCGLWLPGNLFHVFFWNNTAYHDVHHQLHGTRYNFSQNFFIHWDKILGTHMPYTLEKRDGGGFETRPVKKKPWDIILLDTIMYFFSVIS